MMTALLVSVAALIASAPAAAQPVPATQFNARLLAAQNVLRVEAKVAQVVWDNTLATGAEMWAQHLAQTGIFQHSDRHARRGIGENMWYGGHGRYSPEAMVGLWEAEKRNFVPGIFPNVSRTGNWYDVSHYTQVIWPATQRVGCAVASNARTDYLVCRYATAGNIDGRRVP
jgi:hypothetical protein